MKKKKVKYEVRYFVDDNISALYETITDEDEAVRVAKYKSRVENDRIYFVKKVTEQIVFFVGEWG